MKKHTRMIIVVAIFAAIAIAWIWLRNDLRDKMADTLSARYPTDSITLDNVRLSILPFGAKADAFAEQEELDFEVTYVKGIGEDDRIEDNLYEARTREFYTEILATRLERYEETILSHHMEPVIIGTASLNDETGRYPVAVDLLLDPSIATADDFVETVQSLAESLQMSPIAGVQSWRFISFPGSVLESDLPEIGLSAAWLTQPTPTPTPSPTPRPTTEPTGTVEETTEGTTEEPTTTGTTKPGAKPPFSYEITILTEQITEDFEFIRNGVRTVTYTSKELQELADDFELNDESADLLEDAQARQTQDNAPSTRTSVTTTR